MRKRITAIVLAILVFLLSGCQPLSFLSAYLSEDIYDADKYRSEYEDHWEYQQLSAEEKRFYGSIYTAVTDTVDTESYITCTDENNQTFEQYGVRVYVPDVSLSKEDITQVYEAFFADNPQYFYLDRTYSFEGIPTIDGQTLYNALILQYLFSAEQRVQAQSQLQTVLNTILADKPASDDDYETERYLHDQLTVRCTYDITAAEQETIASPNAYSAYGALVEGKAVCEGYAKAMQLLLQESDIPATLVTGTAKENNESHMWNLVTINGENYHLDSTWNDNNDNQQYTFFNLTTEMVSQSVTIENPNNFPLCTATEDNYFVRNDTVIDTYERQMIAQKIANRVLAGDTIIQLRFANGKFENGILFLKNQKLMNSMVNEHLKAHGISMWDYELWADNGQQVLTLIKKGDS